MELILQRIAYKETYTIGRLYQAESRNEEAFAKTTVNRSRVYEQSEAAHPTEVSGHNEVSKPKELSEENEAKESNKTTANPTEAINETKDANQTEASATAKVTHPSEPSEENEAKSTFRETASKVTFQELQRLYRNPELICNTLEPAAEWLIAQSDSEKKPACCIPSGRYPVVITHSPKFNNWLPLLLNVPGRSGIRIHCGNLPEHTLGCILPGINSRPGMVEMSTHYLYRIKSAIVKARERGEAIHITVM